LLTQIKTNTDKAVAIASHHTEEKSRGRLEIRHTELFDNLDNIDPQWVGLKRLIRVRRSGHRPESGPVDEYSYYIASIDTNDAETMATGIRKHWGIENRLHWVKDVNYNEDGSRISGGSAPENMSVLKNIAINIYRRNGFQSIKHATIKFANKIKELKMLITEH
jgi:predicted transposase YbfD/YdcC